MKAPEIIIPFVDLAGDYHSQKLAVGDAIGRVLESGVYILGEEVRAFEKAFAAFCGCEFATGVASGTDALLLALKAFDVGPGDEVILPAHTAVATAAAVELSGARPVLVDIDERFYTLDAQQLAAALSERTKAIIAVHIYGQPADMAPILAFAEANKLIVIEDCAQAHGAMYRGLEVGSMGHAGAFSFYPTKNLGAIGDGGAVVCHDAAIAARLRRLRQYGWRERYVSEEVGYNSRLDELQAAILRVKLRTLAAGNEARQRAAGIYGRLLADSPLKLPGVRENGDHVFHLFVVQAPQREGLRRYLLERGIATAVHYPLPIHLQPAYAYLGYEAGALPVSEALAQRALSLPMFPGITADQVQAVSAAVNDFYAAD